MSLPLANNGIAPALRGGATISLIAQALRGGATISGMLIVLFAGACSSPGARSCPGGRDDRVCVHGSLPRAQSAAVDDTDDTTVGANAEQDAGLIDPHAILVGEVVNARDLGGTPLADGAAVAPGVLFRGPPLAELTPAGCQKLAALGIRTVIDLRTESVRESRPDDPCVYEQANLLYAPLPVPSNVSPEDYLADLNTTDSIAAAFRAMGDEAAYPIYFHCTWGRDRTGVLAAVVLLALGAERSAIMDEYLLSRPTVGAYPESLAAVLDDIEQRGGIGAYFEDAAIADDWVATLRTMAIATAR